MSYTSLPESFKSNPNLHAYLFVSPDKTVRTEGAKLICMSMLCENRNEDSSPCLECSACKKVMAASHPDCISVSGADKTSVDDVRAIEDEAYLAPNEADCKVFLLSDADEYNPQSQNALLKIIEEPPKGVKFVLTASSAHSLLPTVRSRVCTLSGQNRSIDTIKADIQSIKKALSPEQISSLSYFIYAYDKADVKEIDETAFFEYTDMAEKFFSGKDLQVLLSLPKKREELMLCLQIFMLCCRQIACVKCIGKLTEGILSSQKLSSCNSKTSMKRAHALYDVFEKAFLQIEEYANINAALSYIWQNAK